MRTRESDMKTSLAQWMVRSVFVFLLLGLGGCGGGGGGSNYAGGGIGGSGISVGAITAIGSIEVDGVNFDTSGATIFVGDDNEGTGDQAVHDFLDVGKMVVVEGAVDEDGNTGIAYNIYFEADVVGRIESIDNGAGEMIVLDQKLAIDEATVLLDERYGPPGIVISLDDFSEDDSVEVSGYLDFDGTIRATYVGKKAALNDVEVKGVVAALDTSAHTFKIRNLTVQYGAGTTELPDGEPREGQLVRVSGTLQSKSKLEASRIQLAREARIFDEDRMEVEGFVTDFISSTEFVVGYRQQVVTDHDTKFIGGSVTELERGVKVKVKGRLEKDVLLAKKLTFVKK
jgi:hypothetical protein